MSATLNIRVMFGGVLSQLGWFFLGFGLIFVAIFNPGASIAELVHFAGSLDVVQGTATGWREVNLEINDESVFETTYAFDVAGGGRYAGASYQTGRHLESGQPVSIEYRAGNPAVSRIQGMRSSAAGAWISFIYLFPLIGLVFVLVSLQKGIRARSLLANGRLALGTLKNKEPTNTVINNQRVYKLTFEFQAGDGRTHQAVAKTHLPYELEDEPKERLVYDPARPSDAVMLDELPARPAVARDGHFETVGFGETAKALVNLVIPLLTLLGHGAYALLSR